MPYDQKIEGMCTTSESDLCIKPDFPYKLQLTFRHLLIATLIYLRLTCSWLYACVLFILSHSAKKIINSKHQERNHYYSQEFDSLLRVIAAGAASSLGIKMYFAHIQHVVLSSCRVLLRVLLCYFINRLYCKQIVWLTAYAAKYGGFSHFVNVHAQMLKSYAFILIQTFLRKLKHRILNVCKLK